MASGLPIPETPVTEQVFINASWFSVSMILSKKRPPTSPEKWWQCPPADLVGFLKVGVPAAIVQEIAGRMGLSTKQVAEILGFSASTLLRKIRNDQVLNLREGEVAIGVIRLIGQVEAFHGASVKPFDAATWFAAWIMSPIPALNHATPAEFLDTCTGQQLISRTLAAAVHGSYM